jgi:hypothetical protein
MYLCTKKWNKYDHRMTLQRRIKADMVALRSKQREKKPMRQGPRSYKLRKDGMRPVIQRSQGGSLIVVQYCRKDPNINKAPCRCQGASARIKVGRARSRHQAARRGFCKENCLHRHNLGYLGILNFGYTG